MKLKALFIINPISGGKKKDGVPELIEKYFAAEKFTHAIVFSDGVAHARMIAKEAEKQFDLIVAVGGDGTVNEVASALIGSNTGLGIVPYGSGNGLSRFLGIPMDPLKAIKALTAYKTVVIDSATINGMPFFNIAGMGFDAHISEVFANGKTRGFFSYVKAALHEFSRYEPQKYSLVIDGEAYEREAFIISFANSSQYGNNAHISRYASVQDGLLDVCIIKKFPLSKLPEMGLRMLTKTSEYTRYVEVIRGKHISVRRSSPGPLHIDGEPRMGGINCQVEIVPASLKVIAGEKFKSKVVSLKSKVLG